MSDMLSPSPGLLCKLASAIVHADELLSPHGHELDREAFIAVMGDAEVNAWIEAMSAAAMAPRKRAALKVIGGEHK